jgi:DUF3011 family protein
LTTTTTRQYRRHYWKEPTMTRTFGSALLSLLVILAATSAMAQGYHHRPPHHRPREVRCESKSRRSTYCRTGAYGAVRLQRQLSDTPCREYDTWGSDRDGGGVWVWDGCRAVFVVVPWGGGPGYGSPGRPPQPLRITCKSENFRPQYCPMPRWGRVRLERRLSDAKCREYDTWGVDGGGIWVDRGCAAVFSVQ